ncbi:MAG: hypothetical protein ACOZF0_05170 [Thermodesulfobacteriota bacterium]
MENPLYHQLGKFIVDFQGLEAQITDIVLLIVKGNSEFVRILIRQHEFSNLIKTTDVLFSRYVDERAIDNSEKAKFHNIIVECLKLAEIRNNLVHSQYFDLVDGDETVALVRENSKLSGGKGARIEESEDMTEVNFKEYFKRINDAINELEAFRLKIIDWHYPTMP